MIEISDHRNPVWLADHCDREDAFERALSAMIVQLMEDNRHMARALSRVEGMALADEPRDLPTIATIAGDALQRVVERTMR